jgi:hypothetical protein
MITTAIHAQPVCFVLIYHCVKALKIRSAIVEAIDRATITNNLFIGYIQLLRVRFFCTPTGRLGGSNSCFVNSRIWELTKRQLVGVNRPVWRTAIWLQKAP